MRNPKGRKVALASGIAVLLLLPVVWTNWSEILFFINFASHDHQKIWEKAISSIADRDKCPMYNGLRIKPQMGLVPIGKDPESKLWEFAHLQTGEIPERGADGRLILTEETNLVFVLLPGGTFYMGAQGTDPNGMNYDPRAESGEGPVHEVTLGPFFLSKYEMTQGQWLRFREENPSYHGPDQVHGGKQHSLLHPVEQVSWTMCDNVLKKLGLLLPTEAQWEYGARGGTTTVWWTGNQRESLKGKVNLADQSAAKAGATWRDIKDWPELDDGYVVHAPVGTYDANGFGLHEVHGNVWEWCRDWYGSYNLRVKEGDGERQVLSSIDTVHVNRGASFYGAARHARSARRLNKPEPRGDNLGLRPAIGVITE